MEFLATTFYQCNRRYLTCVKPSNLFAISLKNDSEFVLIADRWRVFEVMAMGVVGVMFGR